MSVELSTRTVARQEHKNKRTDYRQKEQNHQPWHFEFRDLVPIDEIKQHGKMKDPRQYRDGQKELKKQNIYRQKLLQLQKDAQCTKKKPRIKEFQHFLHFAVSPRFPVLFYVLYAPYV